MAANTKKAGAAKTTRKKKATEKPTAPAPVRGTALAEPTKPNPKTRDVPGVRPMRTRPYLAGQIIAKHGLAAGVTDAMVAELDAAYGRPNATESQFCLKNAFHAVRGYSGVAEDAVESGNEAIQTKLDKLKEIWATGDYRRALKLAATWPRLGTHRAAIQRGWAATSNADMYLQLGEDPVALYNAGLAAVAARYGLEPAKETTP